MSVKCRNIILVRETMAFLRMEAALWEVPKALFKMPTLSSCSCSQILFAWKPENRRSETKRPMLGQFLKKRYDTTQTF